MRHSLILPLPWALPSGAAEPWLPSVAVRALHLLFRVLKTHSALYRGALEGGLSLQQSHSSLRLHVRALHCFEPHGSFSIEQGSPFRCSKAAAPFGRSESPPSIVSSLMAHSASDGALPYGAAEPWLPSVAVRALHLLFRVLKTHSALYRGSPGGRALTAAEPQLPSVSCENPPSFRASWLIQHQTELFLPVQQSHSSLRSQ